MHCGPALTSGAALSALWREWRAGERREVARRRVVARDVGAGHKTCWGRQTAAVRRRWRSTSPEDVGTQLYICRLPVSGALMSPRRLAVVALLERSCLRLQRGITADLVLQQKGLRVGGEYTVQANLGTDREVCDETTRRKPAALSSASISPASPSPSLQRAVYSSVARLRVPDFLLNVIQLLEPLLQQGLPGPAAMNLSSLSCVCTPPLPSRTPEPRPPPEVPRTKKGATRHAPALGSNNRG